MKQKITQTLFNYWNEVRQDRVAPRRFEIEPAQIASILPHTFILERRDAEYRFRLAGTAVCDAFGQEFRETNFLDGWPEDDAISLERLLSVATQQGGVGILEVEAATAQRRTVTFEAIILPLVHTRDSIDRLLGAISPVDAADWLGYEPLTSRRLVTSKIVWPNGKPQSVLDLMHRQAPFLPHVRKARIVRSERRQFRVYDGGRTDAPKD
jgi:hypothetical protein